jgi:hypothetical protein
MFGKDVFCKSCNVARKARLNWLGYLFWVVAIVIFIFSWSFFFLFYLWPVLILLLLFYPIGRSCRQCGSMSLRRHSHDGQEGRPAA